MVNEEAVGLVVVLAVRAQHGADVLRLLARVREHEALLAPCVLEDVADARIGVEGSRIACIFSLEWRNLERRGRRQAEGVPRDLLDLHHLSLRLARLREELLLRRLRARRVEVLHGKPPHAGRLLHARDDRLLARAGGEERAHGLGVADGGREPDAARLHAGHAAQTLDEAKALPAAVPAQERVDLVDHHVAQVAEELAHGRVAAHEDGLEGLGRELEDARGVPHELGLVRLGDVAVPVPYGDVRLRAEVGQAVELVVYQRFRGSDVDGPHARGRIFPELGEDGEERRLRLARRRLCGKKHVVVRVEDGLAGSHLDAA